MDKLREWLNANDISVSAFAQRCGVTRGAVHAWLQGRAAPNRTRMAIVARETDGAVSAEDWVIDARASRELEVALEDVDQDTAA